MSDPISRQATLDALDAICDRECEYPKKLRAVMCASCRLGSAFDAIDELPSAERHGRWIDPEDPTCYKCSICGEYATQEYGLNEPIFWRYCPNCGAKMDGEQNG